MHSSNQTKYERAILQQGLIGEGEYFGGRWFLLRAFGQRL
jgi:hypothetical protein